MFISKMDRYDEETKILENEELKSMCDVTLYTRLMAYYLVQNKLNDARFLWCRIPSNLKTDNQLQQLNILQHALSTNNLNLFFKNISTNDWSDDIKKVMDDLKKFTKEKVLQLIGNAYTSILKENLVTLTNLNEDELKHLYLELEWTFESEGEHFVVHPKRPVLARYNKAESEYQLSKLTEFVSFLEN